MAITTDQIKTIRQELNTLKPACDTLVGNKELTIKQTIIALAPTLERMKKRGFELLEIVAKLREKGIEIKPQTLAKYLAEARRKKDERKTKRQPTVPHCSAPKTACRNAGTQAADTPPRAIDECITPQDNPIQEKPRIRHGAFEIISDTPLDEL